MPVRFIISSSEAALFYKNLRDESKSCKDKLRCLAEAEDGFLWFLTGIATYCPVFYSAGRRECPRFPLCWWN